MRKVFKTIRFSSVGVFFAGIIGVIQGCSVEREGALLAALLFLLNFCSGPVADNDNGPLLPTPIPTLVVDPFQGGGGGTTPHCGSGSSFGPSGFVLFGSRLESMTVTGGTGTVDVTHFNNFSLTLTGDCAGEYLLRYPHDLFAATPVDLTPFSKFTITVLSISGTANITLELHDGTNLHEIVLGVGTTGDFVYLLSDYDSNGVDLTQVSRVIFAIDATGPFSIEIAGPLEFK